MAALEIKKYGDPILRLKAGQVEDFGEHLLPFIDNMRETCLANDGAGLAAPQVGESIRMAFILLKKNEDERVELAIFNPEIVAKEGKSVIEEGCLSIPDVTVEVPRASKVKLRYQDYTGAVHETEAEELSAHIIQHEIDHLHGVLIIDYLSAIKRSLLKGQLKKIMSGEYEE